MHANMIAHLFLQELIINKTQSNGVQIFVLTVFLKPVSLDVPIVVFNQLIPNYIMAMIFSFGICWRQWLWLCFHFGIFSELAG